MRSNTARLQRALALLQLGAATSAERELFAASLDADPKYIESTLAVANKALLGVPSLANLFHPDRWLLWLGLLFVLSVYHFPTGVVGRLRAAASRKG